MTEPMKMAETTENKDLKREEYSGRVFINDGHIFWEHKEKILAEIPIDKIKLIGEYTTTTGPYCDDWFIVFMTDKEEWKEISEYANGMNEVLKQLSDIFRTEIIGTLFASATWKTNILWPDNLKGKEMWTVDELQAKTFKEKINKFLGLGSPLRLYLTTDAEKAFE